jgi:hypothetical protein
MTRISWQRLAALAGFAFVVLWFAALTLARFAPPERV